MPALGPYSQICYFTLNYISYCTWIPAPPPQFQTKFKLKALAFEPSPNWIFISLPLVNWHFKPDLAWLGCDCNSIFEGGYYVVPLHWLFIEFIFFLARLYWTLLRIDHQHRLLSSGFHGTYRTLKSGDLSFLIHNTHPTQQRSTNYSISSLAIQHSLQGIVKHAVIINGHVYLLPRGGTQVY